MIGDPAQLGSEAEALRALCAQVGGPVWRLDPFHYAFRARPEDLGGRLAAIAPDRWTAALEAALRRRRSGRRRSGSAPPTSCPAEAERSPTCRSCCCAPQGAAVAEGLAAAGPGTQAVIQARFAVEAARLAAGAEPGSALARRLAVIETRQEEILEMLVERAEEAADPRAPRPAGATLAAALERLDAQAAALAGSRPRPASSPGASPPWPPPPRSPTPQPRRPAAFRQDLGLTLAEFLARLEQAAARPAARAALAPALAPRLG